MISNLSSRLTDRLISSGSIETQERELYEYGFYVLLSQLVYFVFTCVLGLLAGCFIESIIFHISFRFIRKFAGGYHASTQLRCTVISVILISACIGVIRLSKTYDFQTALLAVTLIAGVVVFALAPLDTPEKPLSDKERKHYGTVSRIICAVLAAVSAATYAFGVGAVFVPCCLALCSEFLLLSAGKIKQTVCKQK